MFNRLYKPSDFDMDANPLFAKNCVHIFIYEQVSIRLCHRDKSQVISLKNILTFGVLKVQPKTDIDTLFSKLFITYFR